MKVILKQDIKGVGKKDQIINASDGYAQNFLFPKNLAVPADKGNMSKLQAKKDSESFKKVQRMRCHTFTGRVFSGFSGDSGSV